VGPFLENKLGTRSNILSMVMAGIVSLSFAQYHQHTKYMSSSKYLMEEGIDPYDYQEENLTFDQQIQVENYLYSVGNTKGFSGIIFSMTIMYLLFNFLEIRKILINLFIGYVLFEMISTVFFTEPEFSHYIGSGDYAHLGGFVSGILFFIWHKKTHI
jgi:membrane associated rhomboid family serine protease